MLSSPNTSPSYQSKQKGTTYRTLLNLPPKAPSNLLDTIARDTINHGLAARNNNSNIIFSSLATNHTDESASAKFVDLLVSGAVQVEGNVIPLPSSLVTMAQHRRIVASNLGTARPVGRGTVKVLQNQRLDGVRAVVDTRGDDEYRKEVLLRRAEAELGRATEDLGTDVQSRARLVRRDELGVQRDSGLDGVDEEVDGRGRDADELGAVLHALGVLVGAEDGDRVVAGKTESLETLVGLLAVVEGGRHAVHADVGVGDEAEGRPFACFDGVGGFDVAVYCQGEERLILKLFRVTLSSWDTTRQDQTRLFFPPNGECCTDVFGPNEYWRHYIPPSNLTDIDMDGRRRGVGVEGHLRRHRKCRDSGLEVAPTHLHEL